MPPRSLRSSSNPAMPPGARAAASEMAASGRRAAATEAPARARAASSACRCSRRRAGIRRSCGLAAVGAESRKSARMRAGLRPRTMTRSASSTASSMLWVTRKMLLRRNLLLQPQLHQFAAQVLGREHVERGKRFIHEENFRLDRQGARESDALFHAAGELLGIGVLESLQAHRVQRFERAAMALLVRHRRAPAAALRRSPAP